MNRVYAERIDLVMRSHRDRTAPIQKQLVRIYALSLPKITIYPDRDWPDNIERQYNFSDDTQQTIDLLNEILTLENTKASEEIDQVLKMAR